MTATFIVQILLIICFNTKKTGTLVGNTKRKSLVLSFRNTQSSYILICTGVNLSWAHSLQQPHDSVSSNSGAWQSPCQVRYLQLAIYCDETSLWSVHQSSFLWDAGGKLNHGLCPRRFHIFGWSVLSSSSSKNFKSTYNEEKKCKNI